MAARCAECEELVSSNPYPDEKQITYCSCCENTMCEDDAIRLGGICTECKKVLEAP